LLHSRGQDKEGAWETLDQLNLKLDDNLLNYFITASVAHYTGKNDQVISILSKRPTTSSYYPFPFLDYMIGNAKLNRLDRDADLIISKNFFKIIKAKIISERPIEN
jgi:hypothetical protein